MVCPQPVTLAALTIVSRNDSGNIILDELRSGCGAEIRITDMAARRFNQST